MRIIILTSAGFENKKIEEIYLHLVGKEPQYIRSLFVPTAAIDKGAIAMLPKCYDDLLSAGLVDENITTYDLDYEMTFDELKTFDSIYFCGGSPNHLLNKIYEVNFDIPLKQFIENDGIYIGVSAGSYIATQNLEGGLSYVNCTLAVHQKTGATIGKVDKAGCPHISLTDNQAILCLDDEYEVIE